MDEQGIMDEFDSSLLGIIDSGRLPRYDNWVFIFEKMFAVFTGLYTILQVALAVVIQNMVGLLDIYKIAIGLIGFVITAVIGIGYRYAIAEEKVHLRIRIVLFGVLCLLFGLPFTICITFQVIIQPTSIYFLQANLAIGAWLIAVFLWGVLLGDILTKTVSNKMKVLLLEHAKPFHKVLANTFTNNIFRQRTFAFSICVFIASFVWILLNPESWFMPIYYGAFVIVVYLLGKGREDEYERKYYGYEGVIDIATFALQISSNLQEFGIRDYKVHHKVRFFSGYVSVFLLELFPEGYSPVMIIYSSRQGIDLRKVQTYFNESWGEEVPGRVAGPFEFPFRLFQGRTLIDSRVYNADKILWWGFDRRIAVSFEGKILREIQNLNSGDFQG